MAALCAHHGEEPGLSGSGGAGTVFLAGCPLGCSYCQNHQISGPDAAATRAPAHWRQSVEELARGYLALQARGCHNVEWVTPTPHLPALVLALALARERGLELPVVFNSGGYERPGVLRLLQDVVDVYLPDAKYGLPGPAAALSDAPDYVEVNRRALREMWRQVGPPHLDRAGLLRRGLVVRHLVLPGHLASTEAALRWLAEAFGPTLWVSLMAQYYPPDPEQPGPLGRRLTRREYDRAVDLLLELGLHRGWVQDRRAHRTFRPDFSQKDPFGSG